MARIYDNGWFRGTLLLAALGAGLALTQAVPSYEEMAALREKPAAADEQRKTYEPAFEGVTGVDVDQRHLNSIRRIA